MGKKIRKFLPIIIFSLFPTLLIWLPFFLRLESFWSIPLPSEGMATIVANYDGPLYIVVAKTLYNPELVSIFSFTLPPVYYSAHFPLYPLVIKIVSPLTGFPYATLVVTLLSSVLAVYFFRKLISKYVKGNDVLWITFLFCIFPARWLIVRSVGSPEPFFIASIIASVYFFKEKKYLSAGIWGALAQMTKSPGILLFVAFVLAIFVSSFKKAAMKSMDSMPQHINLKKTWPVFLIPLSLMCVFLLYKVSLGDFFAYFNSGDNHHLFFPPFQIFDYSSSWVGTFWLEEIIFVYLLGFLGLIKLYKMGETKLLWFPVIFFITILFVSHRDIIRYSLPIVPFLFVGFSKELVKKEMKYAILLIIIPIYLFSLAYISQNVMPISDWSPLL